MSLKVLQAAYNVILFGIFYSVLQFTIYAMSIYAMLILFGTSVSLCAVKKHTLLYHITSQIVQYGH